MSLEIQTHSATKRVLEEDERLPLSDLNPQKRSKFLATTSPVGRCGNTDWNSPGEAYSVGATALLALRALFPQMDDKTISSVLEEYGSNVDAAIKHLNDLRLSRLECSQKEQTPHDEQRGEQEDHCESSVPAGARPEESTPLADQSKNGSINDIERNRKSIASGLAHIKDKNGEYRFPSAEEWVDELVSQMLSATDLQDAKNRAAHLLQAFEEAIQARTTQSGNLEFRCSELEKENNVLKRAVAIQNARLQEISAKEQDIAHLQNALESTKERVHNLEMQNFSLQMHLKAATDARDISFGNPPRNPDIF